ncbi:MAG: hypothetical protein Q9170_007244 [Blastenia crenularia]
MGLPIDSREQLLTSLRGHILKIPDLQGLLKQWPQYVHLEVDHLRGDVDKKLRDIFPEGKRLSRTQAVDIGLFAASWWPFAPYEALKTAAYISIWVYRTELDSAEFSSFVTDYDRAADFRNETLEFIERCLLPGEKDFNPAASNAIIDSFRPIGEAITKACSADQVKTLAQELRFFIEMTGLEQQIQMSGKLPSLGEYHQRRVGSSAVRVCLAITEDMETLWEETNIIVSTYVQMAPPAPSGT